MPWLGRKMDEGVSVGGRAACPVPTVDEATTIDRPEQATDTNLGPTPRASHPHRADQLCDFFVGFDYRTYIVGESSEYSVWVQDFSGIEQRDVILPPADSPHAIGAWNTKDIRVAFV